MRECSSKIWKQTRKESWNPGNQGFSKTRRWKEAPEDIYGVASPFWNWRIVISRRDFSRKEEHKGIKHLMCLSMFRTLWTSAASVWVPRLWSKWRNDHMRQLLTSERPKYFMRKKIDSELTTWLGCDQYLPGSHSANTEYWFNKKKKKMMRLGK